MRLERWDLAAGLQVTAIINMENSMFQSRYEVHTYVFFRHTYMYSYVHVEVVTYIHAPL